MSRHASKVVAACVLSGAACLHAAHSTELIYVPINPSFGGNPLNGAFLLNSAQAQNDKDDPHDRSLLETKSDLERFSESLQRSILNRVAASLTSSIVGADGELQPGIIETSDFVIEVIDQGNGALRIVTTDKLTGETSAFEINTTL